MDKFFVYELNWLDESNPVLYATPERAFQAAEERGGLGINWEGHWDTGYSGRDTDGDLWTIAVLEVFN